jgi:hypothetical protein
VRLQIKSMKSSGKFLIVDGAVDGARRDAGFRLGEIRGRRLPLHAPSHRFSRLRVEAGTTEIRARRIRVAKAARDILGGYFTRRKGWRTKRRW